MTISSEQRRLTPVEQAEAQVADIQSQIQELYREGHVLADQASAARQRGDNPELERLNQLIRENTVAYRTLGGIGGGKLDEAKQQLANEQQRLRQARERAGQTARAIQRLDGEINELEQRLLSLKSQRAAAQQAATAAEGIIGLEPSVVVAPVLAAPIEPASIESPMPRDYPAPVKTISGTGYPSRYFNQQGLEVDKDGKPLDVQPEPPAPHKPDPNAATTAPSLY